MSIVRFLEDEGSDPKPVTNARPLPVSIPPIEVVSNGLTEEQLRASAVDVRDDYQGGTCLAWQTGTGAVLTFTFAEPVQMVHVEAVGSDGDVATVDPFGSVPSPTVGIRAAHEVPVYLPVETSEVLVYAPAGMVVAVNGFRRA